MGTAACLWNTELLEQGFPNNCYETVSNPYLISIPFPVKETILFETCF